MSVRMSSLVWEKSSHKGNRLLTLLALADICNREGIAWPSVGTIAEMVKVKERQAQYILRDLENTGELYTHLQTGRTCPNFYLVATGLDAPSIESALATFLLYPQDLARDVAALLIKGQQGTNIRADLDELEQPFTAFFEIRRLIMTERKRAQRNAPHETRATPKKKKAQPTAPLHADEKKAQEPAGRGAVKDEKGAVPCTHEPMNHKHEPFVIEGVGELGDYFSTLLPWFVDISGLPLPDHNTTTGADEIQRRWISPLQRLGQAVAFEVEAVKDLFLWGLNYADTNDWGNKVAAPGSLEKAIRAEQGRRSRQARQHKEPEPATHAPAPPREVMPPERAEAHARWEGIKSDLLLQMTRETYNTWLKPTRASHQDNGTMHVTVENAYMKEWLENRLLSVVERTAAANTGGAVQEVQFSTKPPAN
jgi:hypothetical protein